MTSYPIITVIGQPQIYQTDWQGTNLLSPTPRTNLVGYTAIASGTSFLTGWTSYNSATVESGFSAPDGSNNAIQVTQAGSGNPFGVAFSSGAALPANTNYCSSVWIRMTAGSALFVVAPDDDGDEQSATVGTTWQQVVNAFPDYQPYTSQNRQFQVVCQDPTAAPFRIYAPQTVVGLSPGIFIHNGAASVAVTDYTLSGAQVSLRQVPQSSATLQWTGTGTIAVPA